MNAQNGRGLSNGQGYLTRRVMISSMHSLGDPKLSDAENLKTFGKCYKTHGHNYYIEATVAGPIDARSGLCCDRNFLDDVLQKEIVAKYDGVHLNDHFKNTSGEDLALDFYALLKEKLKPLRLVMVRLQETPKNFFVYGDPEIPLNDRRFLMY